MARKLAASGPAPQVPVRPGLWIAPSWFGARHCSASGQCAKPARCGVPAAVYQSPLLPRCSPARLIRDAGRPNRRTRRRRRCGWNTVLCAHPSVAFRRVIVDGSYHRDAYGDQKHAQHGLDEGVHARSLLRRADSAADAAPQATETRTPASLRRVEVKTPSRPARATCSRRDWAS